MISNGDNPRSYQFRRCDDCSHVLSFLRIQFRFGRAKLQAMETPDLCRCVAEGLSLERLRDTAI
ncbi:hypothetical protein KOR42_51710 [Thalassoglobus neptunius]|uniref:Uncharacterized protein n=1 Tax=Thalassoglobus neptunius TaxID=1938619 RepID=A0A5C5VP69_9PLAN|nr:hypothetical protein KOR42_51710 [Thalassoglobus neptunius]